MKQVYGIWFPDNDTHFNEGMIHPNGDYQRDIFDLALKHVSSPKIFFDVGAHVGLWSLMAHRAGFKIIEAFEPNPATFECLQKNVGSFARVSQIGIGASRRNAKVKQNDLVNSGAVNLEDDEGGDVLISPITLDKMHKIIWKCNLKPHETLIKIDVEGMEADCVLGMDKIIYALRPVMCVEQRSNHDALRILEQMGMEVVKIARKDYILKWKNL